jgi:hypothetical protein
MCWPLSRASGASGALGVSEASGAPWTLAASERSLPWRVARCDCGFGRLSPILDDFLSQRPPSRPAQMARAEAEMEAVGSVAVAVAAGWAVVAKAAAVVAAGSAVTEAEPAASEYLEQKHDSLDSVRVGEPSRRQVAWPSHPTRWQRWSWKKRLSRLGIVRPARVGADAGALHDRASAAPATPGCKVFPQRRSESHGRIPARPARGSRRRPHSRATRPAGIRARSDACLEYSSAIRRTFMRRRRLRRRRSGSYRPVLRRKAPRRRGGGARPSSARGSTRRSRSWR